MTVIAPLVKAHLSLVVVLMILAEFHLLHVHHVIDPLKKTTRIIERSI